MKPRCIQTVQAAAQAAGRRALTAGELQGLEDRLRATMRRLAGTEKDWQAKTADERMLMAAQVAMEDIRVEADRKVRNAQLQVLKTAATEERIESLLGLYSETSRSKALARDMVNADHDIAGLRQATFSRLIDLMDAVKSGEGASAGRRVSMWLFDAENPAMSHDLAREIYRQADGSTGNKVAQEGAKAYLQVAEEYRQRFNAAGGDVGKLPEGYLPPPWDAARVRKAGADGFAQKVAAHVNRDRMLNEDGSRMSDGQVLDLLRAAHETIATEGLNKTEPGAFRGDGARANKGSASRVIHLKDGDSWLAVAAEFGRGSMYEAISSHVGVAARDIVLLESYGPNPEAQMRLQFDLAARADGGKLQRVGFGVGIFRASPEGVWRMLNGSASTPASDLAASWGQHLRNIQALKLAGTFLKAFPDFATYMVSTGYNKLPYWEALANLKNVASDADTRQFAAMHGLMAESASRALERYAGDHIRQNWSGRMANSQMRLTLLNAWTDWLKTAFGLTKMSALGRMALQDWHALTQWDRVHLERAGVTEADWVTVRAAQLEEHNGAPMLTPDSIAATGHDNAAQVAGKVLGIIQDEASYAVVSPDLMTRTASTWGGMQAGTGPGELARATMQFKSFPMAMITRHFRRMLDAPVVTDGSAPILANRMAYMGTLLLSTTALGAISLQATQIAQGKDPIDMTGEHAAKFWGQAFAIGGGAGFYGDLLTRDTSSDRSSWDTVGRVFGGPVVGDVADLFALTKGNFDQAAAGKQTHAGAEAFRFARSHLPYINVWYAKAALDHAGLHALQEHLSPGYLSKMQARARKEWHQGFWWGPRSDVPDRAPELGRAFGE